MRFFLQLMECSMVLHSRERGYSCPARLRPPRAWRLTFKIVFRQSGGRVLYQWPTEYYPSRESAARALAARQADWPRHVLRQSRLDHSWSLEPVHGPFG